VDLPPVREDLLFLEPLFVTETKSPKTETKPVAEKSKKQTGSELSSHLPTIEDHLIWQSPSSR
jgi:hypothetical protein